MNLTVQAFKKWEGGLLIVFTCKTVAFRKVEQFVPFYL